MKRKVIVTDDIETKAMITIIVVHDEIEAYTTMQKAIVVLDEIDA